MAKKRKSLIDEVEEMAKEEVREDFINKPIVKDNHKISCHGGAVNVRMLSGEVLGIIFDGTKVDGKFEGDKFIFEYEGHEGYVSKKYVE